MMLFDTMCGLIDGVSILADTQIDLQDKQKRQEAVETQKIADGHIQRGGNDLIT